MSKYEKYEKEIQKLKQGKSEYEWDELEEIITDDLEEENLTMDEYDELMSALMEIEPE